MKPIIRRMTAQDLARVNQLWIDCELSDEPEDSIEDMTEFLGCTQSAGFVAQIDQNIEGAVLCGNDGRFGYIHHLAVSKPHRNAGVGRSLVQACIDFLQKRHIVILVRDSNEAGNEFWSRMSFQEIAALRMRYFKSRP